MVWYGLAWLGVYINIRGRTSNGFYFDHIESCAFIQRHPFHRHFIQSPYFRKSIYYCFIHVPREAPAQNHAHTILICCYVCFFMFWWLFFLRSFVRLILISLSFHISFQYFNSQPPFFPLFLSFPMIQSRKISSSPFGHLGHFSVAKIKVNKLHTNAARIAAFWVAVAFNRINFSVLFVCLSFAPKTEISFVQIFAGV